MSVPEIWHIYHPDPGARPLPQPMVVLLSSMAEAEIVAGIPDVISYWVSQVEVADHG